MIAGNQSFDDIDKLLHANIGRWICIRWQEGLIRPPRGVACGTHLAGSLVCDHQNGIKSINFAWMYMDQAGQLFRVGKILEGINCLWIFKYETLKKQEFRLLTNLEVDFLGLTDVSPPVAQNYSTPDLNEIRQARELDEFRHPGYLDDVAVSFSPINAEKIKFAGIEIDSEGMWVRLEKKIDSNQYEGRLLNNSHHFRLKSGDSVVVRYLKGQDRSFLLSYVPTPEDKKPIRAVDYYPDETNGIQYIKQRERGLKELAAGNYSEAVECLGKAVHLRPDLCEAHFDMGRAFKSMGKIEAARQAFLRAQMIDSKNPNIGSALARLPPPPQGRQDFEVGKVLQGEGGRRYTVLDIKKGGFGSVYIVQIEAGDHCALKTFQAKYLWSDADRKRFEREAITWALLDYHPNVVTLLLIDRIEGFPCLALEYVSGEDLSHLLANGPLTAQKSLELALQFCDGMSYVHKKLGIVHRDIKPSNCLLSKEGVLKVTDFGLARSFGIAREEALGLAGLGPEIRAQYTTAMGTMAYMAPEQFNSAAQLDTRTDIYAFGIMFYQMLTGDLPLSGVIARKHIRANVEIRQMIPEVLLRLILRCVEIGPERRPSNFEEVRDALETAYQALTRKEAPPRPCPTPTLDAGRLSDKGSALAMLGRHEDALLFYNRALEMNPKDSRMWNNKGAALAALGRYEEALACYDRGLDLDPNHFDMRGNKATTLAKLGRHKDALSCLDRGLDLAPRNSRLWGIKGICLNALEQHEKALLCFDRSLEISPRNQLIWNHKGLTLVALQQYDEALTCYDRGLEIAPRDSELWLNKGKALMLMGRIQEATICFTRGGEIDPSVHKKDGEYDPSAGVQFFDGRKLHLEALSGYERDLEINPSDIDALLNKGGTLRALERYEDSLVCYDRALQLAPKDSRLWNEKGLALNYMGRLAEALACFDRGLEINTRDSDLWENKGLTLSELGRNQEAVACFDKGLEINPRDIVLWNSKRDALIALGRHQEATACSTAAAQCMGTREPTSDFWQKKSTAHGNVGNHKEALACCDRGLGLNPHDIVLWNNKGVSLSALGRHEEAITCWDKCLEINPRGSDYWNGKGFTLRKLERFKEAIACYDRGLEIDPRDSGLWLNKGVAFFKMGNIQEAIICYDSGLQITPQDRNLWNNKGIAFKELGLIAEAQACERKAKELGESSCA